MKPSENYRYTSFSLSTVISDMRFNGGVSPGNKINQINLTSTDNQTFKWPRVGSPQLLLLVFGSRTCPATISTIPDIKALYEEFKDKVEFGYLYVREAHPGEIINQPQTIEEKTVQACHLRNEYDIPWRVIVDTIDGTVHHELATRPNAAYLIDADGTVIFRTLFAADTTAIKDAINQTLSYQYVFNSERNPIVYPILKLIGLTWEIVGKAGNSARRDILIKTPFLYIPSRLAYTMNGLSLFLRGSLAMFITLASAAVFSWLLIKWI